MRNDYNSGSVRWLIDVISLEFSEQTKLTRTETERLVHAVIQSREPGAERYNELHPESNGETSKQDHLRQLELDGGYTQIHGLNFHS